MEQHQFKYFAFISYASRDIAWGKRLHKKLEYYRMPATLCSDHNWKRTPMSPIFFAPYDIQPRVLTEELKERLKASRNLIVICSPRSAQSEWVGWEIEYFFSLGRSSQIHFFIIDGQPHSGNPDTECFNPVLEKLGMPEILGANIHEKIYRWPWLNRERAYVQLITRLLGVEFDAVWQRHRRLLVRQVAAWCAGTLLILATFLGVLATTRPVEVEIGLNEASAHNERLPSHAAVVTMVLDNETKTDTVGSLADVALFANIPHHFIGEKVRVMVDCQDFLPVDTMLNLSKALALNVSRNPHVYGDVRFMLWNSERGLTSPHTPVIVNGRSVQSDADGMVSLFIPLPEQATAYPVSSSAITLTDSIITLPCLERQVIEYE